MFCWSAAPSSGTSSESPQPLTNRPTAHMYTEAFVSFSVSRYHQTFLIRTEEWGSKGKAGQNPHHSTAPRVQLCPLHINQNFLIKIHVPPLKRQPPNTHSASLAFQKSVETRPKCSTSPPVEFLVLYNFLMLQRGTHQKRREQETSPTLIIRPSKSPETSSYPTI